MSPKKILPKWLARLTLGQWSRIATIIGTIIALIMLLIVIDDVRTVGDDVEQVKNSIELTEFQIEYPATDSEVEVNEIVRGKSPYGDMIHYLVITAQKTGDTFIEGTPISVLPTGIWAGRVRFGSAATPAGERFLVRAAATKSVIPEGILTETPADLVFSNAIVVTRK